MDIVDFNVDDLFIIKPKMLYAGDQYLLERTSKILTHPGHVIYSLWCEEDGIDALAAIVGGYLFYPGVMEMFSITSMLVHTHANGFIRCMREIMEHTQKEFKLWRFQTTVPVEVDQPDRYAKLLGLEREGLMKQYGPNKVDHVLYSRLY